MSGIGRRPVVTLTCPSLIGRSTSSLPAMSLEPGAAPSSSIGVFAELLRTLPQAREMTQEEFAAKAGVGVRTLRDLERGRARPQRATLELLAAALELEGPDRIGFI